MILLDEPEVNPAQTILLLDDNPGDATALKNAFADVGMVNPVVTFCEAREALAFLRDDSLAAPALILCDLNMPEIKKALVKGGNKDFELVTISGLNHLFQECETGSMNEYISIQETWNADALKRIGDWIAARTESIE